MKLLIRIAESSDGQYRAWCPALPGCDARGCSRQDVMRNMEQAVRAYLAGLDASQPAGFEPQVVEV